MTEDHGSALGRRSQDSGRSSSELGTPIIATCAISLPDRTSKVFPHPFSDRRRPPSFTSHQLLPDFHLSTVARLAHVSANILLHSTRNEITCQIDRTCKNAKDGIGAERKLQLAIEDCRRRNSTEEPMKIRLDITVQANALTNVAISQHSRISRTVMIDICERNRCE